MDKWPSISIQLRDILANVYNVPDFKTEFPKEIEDLLLLLKLFPTKQYGRNVIASDKTFNISTEHLLHVEPVFSLNVISFS